MQLHQIRRPGAADGLAGKEYDKLASDGARVLHGKTALNGKGGTARKRG